MLPRKSSHKINKQTNKIPESNKNMYKKEKKNGSQRQEYYGNKNVFSLMPVSFMSQHWPSSDTETSGQGPVVKRRDSGRSITAVIMPFHIFYCSFLPASLPVLPGLGSDISSCLALQPSSVPSSSASQPCTFWVIAD